MFLEDYTWKLRISQMTPLQYQTDVYWVFTPEDIPHVIMSNETEAVLQKGNKHMIDVWYDYNRTKMSAMVIMYENLHESGRIFDLGTPLTQILTELGWPECF